MEPAGQQLSRLTAAGPAPQPAGQGHVWGVCASALPAQGQPHDKDSSPLALGGFLGAVAHADPSAWNS